MTVFDDLEAEQGRLEVILSGLDESQWLSPSGADGWTVADVVLHLAQSEESVLATAGGRPLRTAVAATFAATFAGTAGGTVDERVAWLVAAERAAPSVVFERWQRARRSALDALRGADPDQPLAWVAAPVKPATLATTRLAEHWAHGLDITGPLGLDFPDTGRLRHVAWLAHRTLPYAMALAGQPTADVRCELTAPGGAGPGGAGPDGAEPDGAGPDGAEPAWVFGRADAESGISGPAGDFCRVAARRLAPEQARLTVSGPHGAAALRLLRTYAE